ncbi:MAG: carboxypeptidase regulatory-like domain-containing protein [Moorea sp. SIO2I5]|nr:carboxypeptidase regulatory-like domain-containing protein [Moorena sp. SIO2I5]
MKWKGLMLLSLVSVLSWSVNAEAHGTRLESKTIEAIEINANYDTGKPMSNAQVTIYAPNNPTTPWQTGTSDTNGRFIFAPDYAQQGNWTIQVRQAGHGGMITLTLGEDNSAVAGQSSAADNSLMISSTSPSYTPVQRMLMAAAGVWGFVGTALFFLGRKTNAHS